MKMETKRTTEPSISEYQFFYSTAVTAANTTALKTFVQKINRPASPRLVIHASQRGAGQKMWVSLGLSVRLSRDPRFSRPSSGDPLERFNSRCKADKAGAIAFS